VFATYLVRPGRWEMFKALFHGKPMSVPGSRVSGVIPWGVSRTRVETYGGGGSGGYDGPVPLEERLREARDGAGGGDTFGQDVDWPPIDARTWRGTVGGGGESAEYPGPPGATGGPGLGVLGVQAPPGAGGHWHSTWQPCHRGCPQYLRQSGNVLPILDPND
jgi:hypothetical protein